MRLRRLFLLCLSAAAAADEEDAGSVPVEALIARLEEEDAEARESAAEELAVRGDEPVVPALRERLATEKNRHVRLALHFALASHGEFESVVALIDSLKEKGHYGCGYLQRVTGREYGWNLDLWQEWLEDTPPERFRRWKERQFVPEEELAGGRAEFAAALRLLRDGEDRARVAAHLEAVAEKHPRSDFAFEARPLAGLLREMAAEDAAWKEPADPAASSPDERVRYHVHHLRDVRVRQMSVEQGCYALSPWNQVPGARNAALDLARLGPEAVPRLLEILEDARPTRSLAYGDEGGRAYEILRLGDVAMQVLNAVTPEPLFPEFSETRFTEVRRSVRKKVVAALRRWDREGRPTDPASRLWLRVDLLGLYAALDTLHALAVDHGRKEDVLLKLHDWYENRHWIYRPHYAALMAELGDRSKVEEVLRWHHEGLYSEGHVERPDDGAASMNAEEAAKRLAAGRPRMSASERWQDTGYGRR